MATWNKIDEESVDLPAWWNLWRGGKVCKCIVHPLEDEDALRGQAKFQVECETHEDAERLAKLVKDSRWTGHLDPENTAEPPPAYPITPSPPPRYEDLLTIVTDESKIEDNQ
jgi:hypothetical protein